VLALSYSCGQNNRTDWEQGESMTGTIFQIGYTACGHTMARLVELHPNSVVGTFWLPSTVKAYRSLSDRWRDYVLAQNQAQAILNDLEIWESESLLDTHMVILLVGNPNNPGEYSFMAGITRFLESSSLLRALARHNISAHTEVSYPDSFYHHQTVESYLIWSQLNLNDWNEYIRRELVAQHGKRMLERWWMRLREMS
jgi:hypothetical protein